MRPIHRQRNRAQAPLADAPSRQLASCNLLALWKRTVQSMSLTRGTCSAKSVSPVKQKRPYQTLY